MARNFHSERTAQDGTNDSASVESAATRPFGGVNPDRNPAPDSTSERTSTTSTTSTTSKIAEGGAVGDAASADGLFERVLVVTGDDAAGRAAIETGIAMGAAHGASVDALYVVEMVHHWDMVVERKEAAGEAVVEEAVDRGAALGVAVEPRFRYGNPHEEVLDFASGHGADLIVLGTAKRRGVDRLVHPETLPTRVRRGADVPVMIVGPGEA